MKLSAIKDAGRNIEQGGWIDDLPHLPGVAVKVRGAFNSDYSKLLAKLRDEADPLQGEDRTKFEEEMQTKLLHQTVLVDWSGIEDAPEYDSETAYQLLTDPDFTIFRRAVVYASSIVATSGRKTLEADAKN